MAECIYQGIFLHIDCVPCWGTAPLHWDVAPLDFLSLHSKRTTRSAAIPILLCTMSRLPQCSVLFPVLASALPCPRPVLQWACFALSCSELCPAMPNALPFELSYNFLPCPCSCSCPDFLLSMPGAGPAWQGQGQPVPALPWLALPLPLP